MRNDDQMTEVEVFRRTVEACDWLLPIAEKSVKDYGWDPAVVRWLSALATNADERAPLQ